MKTPDLAIVICLTGLVGLLACASMTEPTEGHGVWVLESIGGRALPATFSGTTSDALIFADTLTFESDSIGLQLDANEAFEHGLMTLPRTTDVLEFAILITYRGGAGYLNLTNVCPPQSLCTVRRSRVRFNGDRLEWVDLGTTTAPIRVYRQVH